MCPPLIITTDEIDEMFDRLGQALDDAHDVLGAHGDRSGTRRTENAN